MVQATLESIATAKLTLCWKPIFPVFAAKILVIGARTQRTAHLRITDALLTPLLHSPNHNNFLGEILNLLVFTISNPRGKYQLSTTS